MPHSEAFQASLPLLDVRLLWSFAHLENVDILGDVPAEYALQGFVSQVPLIAGVAIRHLSVVAAFPVHPGTVAML